MERSWFKHLAKQGSAKFPTHHFRDSMHGNDLCLLVLKNLPAPFRNRSALHISFHCQAWSDFRRSQKHGLRQSQRLTRSRQTDDRLGQSCMPIGRLRSSQFYEPVATGGYLLVSVSLSLAGKCSTTPIRNPSSQKFQGGGHSSCAAHIAEGVLAY